MTDELTEAVASRFYLDCEFDGHNGPLLSLALVREDGRSIHIRTTEQASDPWVIANVIPIMDSHHATKSLNKAYLDDVGGFIREFLGDCENPTIIADSPVDIGRFCRALSTGSDGAWASADFPHMTFEVHNVDCYPTDLVGAVQHNAWWDAMALRAAIAAVRAHDAANGLRFVKGGPQGHWTVKAAIQAARTVIKAGDDLSLMAQTSGGVAGRDDGLCAAIAHWTADRDKAKQMLRIVELEGDDPEIGACSPELFAAINGGE